jgi:hypothetical protein
MTEAYDFFRRGPLPVDVRTVQAIDIARQDRLLPYEVWYPAAAQYAGRDVAATIQDTFTVLPQDPPVLYSCMRHALTSGGDTSLGSASCSGYIVSGIVFISNRCQRPLI